MVDKLMTMRETSEALHLHPNTIRRWSNKGKLLPVIINEVGRRRFKQSDIQAFIDERRKGCIDKSSS